MEQKLDFAFRNRDAFLREVRHTQFDLLVIGGGITGAGIALDAVTRGLKVCLIEKGDFASGTSGKSTKLIHGGLRYLKQFEFGLVKEVGQERAILHELAPHLVVPEKMLLPLVKDGSLGKTMTSIGLYIYDFLADVEGDDKRRMLDNSELLALEPLLPEDKLLGGSIYAEYRTDDARLTIEVIKTSFRYGALPLSYVRGNDLKMEDGLVIGMQCEDVLSGEMFEIRSRMVVNATGPWVDDVRRIGGPVTGKRLYLTKGSHIVVPRTKLPCRHAIYFDVPNDNRMIFAIPRLGVTYIGTTDTYYEGDKDDVQVSAEDCQYLLNAINLTFQGVRLSKEDIVSSWAGVRPLIYEDGKSASEISRRDEIFESDNGLISIAGGKLTGYRKMSERVVDLVARRMLASHDLVVGPCKTDQLPLTTPHFKDYQEVLGALKDLRAKYRWDTDGLYIQYLVHNYGPKAVEMLDQVSDKQDDILKNLLEIELDYCRDHEMMVSPLDFLVRRSGRIYFMPDTIQLVKERIFPYFGSHYNINPERLKILEKSWVSAIREVTNII